ncbi:stage III sporulation AC/AD family protein [Oscillospiraceae bacterium OttesenSCG-928-G22]|nr:stage III sporulation AC/AD family protein [Oscillospiraceae bacterium OttesenSCG-928-G22]
MEEVVKILGLALVAGVLAMLIKKENPMFAFLIALSAGLAILSFALAFFRPIHTFLLSVAETAGLFPAVTAPLFKGLGIAVLTKLASSVLADAGEKALSSYVDMAGALAALYVSLPLLSAALDMLKSFL